jgi:hypothetical protein
LQVTELYPTANQQETGRSLRLDAVQAPSLVAYQNLK